jgi:hypothetical protein
MLDRESADNPGFLDWPSTRRNWFNEWAHEAGLRVYSFDLDKNAISDFPIHESNIRSLSFVLGIDFGWTHNTAFAVGCWSEEMDRWVELESYKERRMDIEQMAARIRMYQDYYPGLRIVADPDGRREIAELKRRYSLPILNAEKQNKHYWINQYNTDLARGRIQIVGAEASPHVEEMIDLTWETDSNGEPVTHPKTKELVESRRAENDVCDAALYAYRASFHHQYTEPTAPPKKGSPEYFKQLARDLEEEAERIYDAEE